jgi:hypothetical protein
MRWRYAAARMAGRMVAPLRAVREIIDCRLGAERDPLRQSRRRERSFG